MVKIEYFKDRVIAEKAAAEAAAARDAFVEEMELIREFAAAYLETAAAGQV